MKKLTLLLGLVLVAGTAAAQQDSTKEKGTASEPALITESKAEAKAEDKSDKKKEASVKGAEVVSVDASSKTITVKEVASVSATTPGTMTLSVQGKAVSALKDIKVGDFVDLTCKADKKADVSATASGTTATASVKTTDMPGSLSECASVTTITKAPGSAVSSTSPSSISSSSSTTSTSPSSTSSSSIPSTSPSLGSPGGSMTADSSTATSSTSTTSSAGSVSGSVSQGGTLTPDQATVDAEAKARASQPATSTTTTTTTTSSSKTTGPSAKLTAVIVSTDAAAKTITVKNPGQGKSTASASETSVDSLTLPVEGTASSKLADFKAGDRVSITCRESASAGASAMAGSDTGWSLGASRCVAATDIVKAKASASETDPASTKSKTTTDPQPQPKTY